MSSSPVRPLILLLVVSLITSLVASCGEDAAEPGLSEAPEAYDDFGPPLVKPGKADSFAGIPAYDPLHDHAALMDVDFEVLFAPDDPVNTVELELIDAVVAERKSDPATWEDGDNPFRIRYAVYNLRNPLVVQHLIDAAAAGVDVQVLIEAHQLDPAKDWNVADEALIEAGFEFVADHRDLTGKQAETADLIGIEGSGLMHFKARIFETPSWTKVLSGSLNPGDNAVRNDETLHLLTDPAIVAAYQDAHERIRAGERFDNSWIDGAAINVLFTPAQSGPRAVTRIFDWLEAEQEQILLMVFSLRNLTAPGYESLLELLGRKVREGVPVYLITDRKQSDGVDADGNRVWYDDQTEDRLRAVGVRVYEAINTVGPFNAMHAKVAVLGRENVRVITDAANWSNAALGSSSRRAKNYESVLFIDSNKLDNGRTGRRYLAQWLRVLERYASQSASDGEAPFAEVEKELTAHAGWPAQAVMFSVQGAETSWGESVYARGDLDELGSWGRVHGGIPLTTTAETYPNWTSGEVFVPLGTTFAWKAVALFPDSDARWEAGPNHVDRAVPTPLLDPTIGDNGPLFVERAWR